MRVARLEFDRLLSVAIRTFKAAYLLLPLWVGYGLSASAAIGRQRPIEAFVQASA